jgi:hypothetical protein
MATMKLRTAPFLAAIALLCIPLAGLAYIGTFTRLHADDFCIASSMMNIGLWQGVVQWYNTWAGRFMYFFTSHMVSVTGPTGGAIFPTLIISVWLLALSWALLPLVRRANWPYPRRLSVAGAGLILLVLLSTLPSIFQSVYWRDGQVNYCFPLIGLTWFSGWIIRIWLAPDGSLSTRTVTLSAGIAFGVAFCLGGFAEAFDAMQAGALALVLALTLLLAGQETRRRLVPVLGMALAGSLIALVIVVMAPGNQTRRDVLGEGAGLVRIVTFSLRNAAVILGKFVLWNPGWALLATLVPAAGGMWLARPDTMTANPGQPQGLPLHRQTWLRGAILVPVSAFLLATAACAPVVMGMNAYPDDRTILLPQTALVIGVVIASGLIGIGLRRLGWVPNPTEHPLLNRILPVGILIALVLAAVFSLWQTAQQVPDLQNYVNQWDQRHAALLEAHLQGQTDVTAYGLHNRSGIGDLRAEPDYWINSCMAGYYGFSTLRGK